MRSLTFIALVMFLAVSSAYGADKAPGAHAVIFDSTGKKVGKATFTRTADGVAIALQLHGLPPGLHGIHIHETGTCTPPDFKSAGGHFNPFGKRHGTDNPQGMHAGDLPNIMVKADGTAVTELKNPRVTIAPGKGSLFPKGGTALVIHAEPDDQKTDPSGDSGARIACGVITR